MSTYPNASKKTRGGRGKGDLKMGLLSHGSPERPCVLVVDDEDAVRRLIRKVLERAGYSVVEASNGLEALQRYQDGVFKLVVTDLDMPGMRGEEFLQCLANEECMPRFLIISGRLGEIPTEWPFLAKPFLPSELLQRVCAVCSAADPAARIP